MKHIKILSWNVKGASCPTKRKRLEMALRKDSADIFLQETHQKAVDKNNLYLGWTQYSNTPDNASTG